MARPLLGIPPELLVHIISFLPIQPLLKFSQTCRAAHSLANSSLHTLSLGIHPNRVSHLVARLAETQFPQPKETKSFFTPYQLSSKATNVEGRDQRGIGETAVVTGTSTIDEQDPYRVSVFIPDAQNFDYMTLLNFHTALTRSILIRHGATLRHLSLSIWTLTMPIAKALISLSALRVLSIRIEDFPQVRSIPRRRAAAQRAEECEAWTLLANAAVWAPRLNALRIEGGELNTVQLSTLLGKSLCCRELWLCNCTMLGPSLWAFLGSEWEGRSALRVLGVMSCGGQLDEGVLDVIGTLRGLQFLTLHGCHGIKSEVVEERNTEVWGIAECIPPQRRLRPSDDDADSVIEVDPAYLDYD